MHRRKKFLCILHVVSYVNGTRKGAGRKHLMLMSKYLLGFPSIQVSSLFDKQRTLRLEMYLESGFSMLSINSTFAQCSDCSAWEQTRTSHQSMLWLWDWSSLTQLRVAGLLVFQPHKAHKQLSSSSPPALYHVVSKGCVLAVALHFSGHPEKYQLEWLLWIFYRKHIYLKSISSVRSECTGGESFGEHSGSSSCHYSFVMRFV